MNRNQQPVTRQIECRSSDAIVRIRKSRLGGAIEKVFPIVMDSQVY
jgi:hypothetical protein